MRETRARGIGERQKSAHLCTKNCSGSTAVDPIHMGKAENRGRIIMHIISSKIARLHLKLHMRMQHDQFYVYEKEPRVLAWQLMLRRLACVLTST
jgi:hypothetical protein